jgi:hypothetical protein
VRDAERAARDLAGRYAAGREHVTDWDGRSTRPLRETRRPVPEITPTAACVREHLLKARIPEAQVDRRTQRAVGDGFIASDLPVEPPRVAVYWEVGSRLTSRLGDCAKALKAAGFKTEVIHDRPADYLIVWTEGKS